MTRVQLTVNGMPHSVDADGDTPLLWVLRDLLGLTGTKYGCGIGSCGACTVLEGESARRSCQITLQAAEGRSFTTLEGLAAPERNPVTRAWLDEDVSQCGYCQSGMILRTTALLAANPRPTDEDIDAALRSHVCRCGSYLRIRRAIHRAADAIRAGNDGAAP